MHLYVISYDIVDDKRRTGVANCLLGWGRRIQYSVFECSLNQTGVARVRAAVTGLIHHDEDQVLFFDLGPLDGRARDAVEALGKPYQLPGRGPIVI